MAEDIADLVVTGGPVHTADVGAWAEGFAVRDGTIVAVGAAREVESWCGPGTRRLDLAGRLAMPGLIDGHVHLGIGGTQLALELPLLPTDTPDEVLVKVRDWAGRLEPGEWIIGGILGSGTYAALNSPEMLRRLDEASLGHPLLLRDDTMHNRQVNSAALAAMGVDHDTPDPPGGTYARDAEGRLTGGLWELTGMEAEDAAKEAQRDPHGRLVTALRAAFQRMRQLGCTSFQDAATMAHQLAALRDIERAGDLTAWIVASLPATAFIEAGAVGEELFARAPAYRSEQIRPDFVKFVLDGVPTTRTTALLTPYRCCGEHDDPEHRGTPYWTLDELVTGLRRCAELGLGAKIHATGDASVRLALDAAEIVRRDPGSQPIVQIAHPSFIAPEDIPRFAELNVHADACPFMWHPSPLVDGIARHVPVETMERIWPFKDLLATGALIAGGSDWPVGLPELNPWLGIETMVTRSAPEEQDDPRRINPDQAISRERAVAAFTSASAKALGIDDLTGALRPGLSADFLVLDRNIFEVPATQIHNTTVEQTYFRGERVH
ncbi:amidohydrolase [Saccharopolyspora mangrovi]|uniref:Amidohydrolase n=1 Tax=Saccharopolyspora mangrovi TaxID=3082379 RepID=A0ABU6A8G3_9PSEU|nr:amidohydrolase [Saccharopolyspora sp. S2-29]MEB3367758.1 amidohydrolase [Saccharopolyspora sp. S2-29]